MHQLIIYASAMFLEEPTPRAESLTYIYIVSSRKKDELAKAKLYISTQKEPEWVTKEKLVMLA